jgi:hypothetical protein
MTKMPLCLLILVAAASPALAGDLPKACELGQTPDQTSGQASDKDRGQDATLACFHDLDRDGNAALSPSEAEVLPRIRGHFAELDADGDGLLSADEFQGTASTPPQRAGAKGV